MENTLERPFANYTWDYWNYLLHRQNIDVTTEDGRRKAGYASIVLCFFAEYTIFCILRRILEIEYILTDYVDRCPKNVNDYEETKLIYISSRLNDPYIEPYEEGLVGNEWTPTNDWADHSKEKKTAWVKDVLFLISEDKDVKKTLQKIIDIDNIFCEFETKFGDRYNNKGVYNED